MSESNKELAQNKRTLRQLGRTMFETLAVLLVIGLLGVMALKGLEAAMNRSKAEGVLDDVGASFTKMSLSKKGYDKWTMTVAAKKSRSGFDFYGMHTIKTDSDDEGLGGIYVRYVKATIPMGICKPLIKMQSKKFKIYKSTPSTNDIAATPLDKCEEQNEMIFLLSKGDTCGSDSDCQKKYGRNYQCSSGQCRKMGECTSDSDCPANYACNENGFCRAKGCTSDSQCTGGQRCDNGMCTSSCTDENDCPSGYKCSFGGCVRSGCTSSADCSDGQYCKNGSCVSETCTQNSDCEKGYTCQADSSGNKKCQPHCSDNRDCPEGKICNLSTGTCQSNACETAADCGSNAYDCINGVCVSILCSTNADCGSIGSKYVCDNGKCVIGCTKAADCGTGFTCSGGRCVCSGGDAKICGHACCSSTQSCCGSKCITTPTCSSKEKYDPNTCMCGCDAEKGYVSDGAGHCVLASCSYRMTEQEQIRASNCSYRMVAQSQKVAANCWYDVSISGGTASLTAVQGCPANEYCYLNYANEDCSTAIAANATGRFYGTCLAQNVVTTACNVTSVTPVLSVIKGCKSNEYCYLNYANEDCSTALTAGAMGVMYGTCLAQNISATTCNAVGYSNPLLPIQTCPANQYCYLNWTSATCSSTLAGNAMGVMYGACLLQTSNSAVCPGTY